MRAVQARRNIIYGLTEPTGEIRYIGKSANGERRARRKHNSRCGEWQRSLTAGGHRFGVITLQIIVSPEQNEVSDAERAWISYGRAQGWLLTNATDGGEGTPGRKMPQEERARLSRIHRGMRHSPESKAKMSADRKGRKHAPAQTEKIRKSLTGKVFTPERCANISKAKRGKPKSKEHCELMSITRKEIPLSPETKKKMSIAVKLRWERHRSKYGNTPLMKGSQTP